MGTPSISRKFMSRRIFLAVWIVWCLWWFVDGLCSYSMVCTAHFGIEHLEERRMTGLLAVMFAGFPLGFFVPAFISDVMKDMQMFSFNAGLLGYVTEWTIAAVTGYLQWFVLLPLPWRIWKARRGATPPPN
jgi:hypothetical protein